jgi:transcriptional regulator with XRE-family HTH domain
MPQRFHEILREARRIAGWSQDRLGELLGIDQTTVSRLESGRISLEQIPESRIARAIDAFPRYRDSLLESLPSSLYEPVQCMIRQVGRSTQGGRRKLQFDLRSAISDSLRRREPMSDTEARAIYDLVIRLLDDQRKNFEIELRKALREVTRRRGKTTAPKKRRRTQAP